MGDVQKIPLFHPDGSVKGEVEVVYNTPSNVIIGARNLGALRCEELFEYVKRIVTVMEVPNLDAVLKMITGEEQKSRDVCILFWKGDRRGLQMCTKKETRPGIIDGDSAKMVDLFASLNLYNRDYPERVEEAVKEFVNALTN
jgi:hypothetical protein